MQDANAAVYGQEYAEWKGWAKDDFGHFDRADAVYFEAELRRTKLSFPPGSRILEIGFGNGNFLGFATAKGWLAEGTEVNPALIAAARAKGYHVAHAASLSEFADGSFDLVVAWDVLEHIDRREVMTFLKEVKRVQKMGGIFLARFPNGSSPFGLYYQNGDLTHVLAVGIPMAEYFADALEEQIVFLGGEAMPLFQRGIGHFVVRLCGAVVRPVCDLLARMLLESGSRTSFCSKNLVLILRK